MLTEKPAAMPERRIRELIAESEMWLFTARAVQNRPIPWDDADGPQRREAAKAWGDAFDGRLFNLRGMLAKCERKEAV